MKRYLLTLISILCYFLTAYPQATDIVVECQNPGWLSSMISYGDQQTVRNLKVTGYVNATDLKFIGSLISLRNLDGILDLSESNIVSESLGGQDNVLVDLGLTQKDSIRIYRIPKSATKVNSCTQNLYVDTLYFDCMMTSVDQTCLHNEKVDIGHLFLGNNISTIPNGAFVRDPGREYAGACTKLQSVHFPSTITYIGENAFSGSELRYCNFNDLTNLEYLGRSTFINGDWYTFGLCSPDTIIIPQKLTSYPLNAFIYKKESHIYIGENTKTLEGGISSRYTYQVSGEGVTFHINQMTPPEITYWFRYGKWFEGATVYVPKGAKSAYENSGWSGTTIIEMNPLEIISISEHNLSLNETEIYQLSVSLFPENSDDKTILWSSDNNQVASVSGTGLVRALSSGIANIIAMSADGLIRDTCKVTVKPSYNLSIQARGGGIAIYNENAIRSESKTFSVSEGTSAIVSFSPDTGYRIKSVKVNNTDMTDNVSNNRYTISNINADTSLEVEFEAITHTLSITASGNGTATYNNTAVKGKTQSFTVNEGTSATVTFTPDAGYQIASVKLNDTDVTSSVASNKYTISNITANTTLSVTFEAIPPTTYTFSITASGNGTATYNGTEVKGKTQSFTVNEGTSASVTFTPDAGYQIASVKLNGTDVTSSVADNQYTISNIKSDNTLEVEFEAITHNLTIKATGNGTATYNSTAVKGKTQTFSVYEGKSATITFTPDAGNKIKSVKLNSTDITAGVVNNQYTISDIKSDNTLEVEFEAIPPSSYTLIISAIGNGTVTYDGNMVKDKTATFTVVEGTNAVVIFSADEDNRLKSVKLNNVDVTSSVKNNQYVISNIKTDMSLEVVFEAIPTYSLSLTASGNGSITYNGEYVRGKTQAFTIIEGTSATITFTPDTGYRIASVKLNGTDVTSSVISNKYVISNIRANTTLAVTFEEIPPTTYALTISVSGNGYVAYNGNTIRGKTSSFNVVEGTNATLKLSADEGNRLKGVKLNGQDVTAAVVGNQYTVSNITASTTIEVVFEEIPTFALNIVASGNGSASYNGATIRNQSQSFTIQEGSSAVVSFSADNGYRIMNVKVNNTDVTSQVSNGNITISNITENTNVEVVFEEIPATMYTLSIAAIGNGSVIYDGKTIKGKTSEFTVVEGSYATITFSADDGYRLKSVTLNGEDVTEDVDNDQYTTTKIMANTTLTVEFEAIPTFSLTIKSTAFGSVKYGGAIITNQTETFSVKEGTDAVLTFIPDGNGRLQRITLNGEDITQNLKNGQHTISDVRANQNVEAEFVEDITKVTDADVAYTVTSYDEQTVVVAAGNYGNILTVPASFTANGKEWIVVGIDEDALKDNTELAAIIWNPNVAFDGTVDNPNLLLYVKDRAYAPNGIKNVIANGVAEEIVLKDAASGNNFYCPQSFTAKRISYEHNYSMISGYKDCQGWETLVLPFDVTMTINSKGAEVVPYNTWQHGSNRLPFWLYQLTSQGWIAAEGIKANVPYIICMPNNEMYDPSYNLTGNIQFIGNNVEVMESDKLSTGQYGNKRLVANFQNKPESSGIYALNVSNEWYQNTSAEKEGSTFIRSLRNVHPFEAYMTVEGSNAPWAIPVFENGTAGITNVRSMMTEGRNEDNWYDLQGRKLQAEPKKGGIYIHNGKMVRK